MRISQKAFNEIVRENIEDFEYPVEEAIQEAIKEAKLQDLEHLSLLWRRIFCEWHSANIDCGDAVCFCC